MAEIAAGALVAEQVVATGLEAAAAASVARPTQPLKASLTQIATSPAGDSSPADNMMDSLALARSRHTVTVIGDKAYIFGGEQSNGRLCNTDVHAISLPSDTKPAAEYACYPAFPVKETTTGELLVPSPRRGHAACARGKYVLVHGGSDENGTPIDEDACIWLWDSETLAWGKVHAVTQIGKSLVPREGHSIFIQEKQDFLVLHGGGTGSANTGDTWLYDFNAVAWTQLPSCPVAPASSSFVKNTIYSISTESNMGGSIHFLNLGSNETGRSKPDALKWEKVDFPANPLAAGPKARVGSALVPVSTGYGRNYLVYLLGGSEQHGKETKEQPYYSDIWSLQLPSQGFTLTTVKDTIRDKLPGHVESGAFSWAEVELVPTEQVEHEGKVHPGPRGFFGAASCLGAKGVVFWGGVNAKGEREADGWLLRIR
ncbi:Acyl-CoA-binding domain-containing protein 4 [Cytospora mali]|uniref:Acyl-CoA-binding domain-containing protein 4 n=1 Tax=Cytospora mali TaxID=578113 RepID=A0A194VLJ9_CYTMA|nr:Acyl-CoA-binding domain-containing protein 4 [Valsa mali]